MGYEIPVAESSTGRTVLAEEISLESIRLSQRGNRGQSSGDRSRDEQRAISACRTDSSRSPEYDRTGDAHAEGALCEPVIGGEESGGGAPDYKEREQCIDHVDGDRAATRDKNDGEDYRYSVESQLLGNEVAIELEQLVRERGNDDREEAELKQKGSGPILHRRNVRLSPNAGAKVISPASMSPL
jgi:hypothetical protein